MSLTDGDLKKIKNVVDSRVDLLDAKMESFRFDVDQRFQKVDERFDILENKVDRLIKTQEEDIVAVIKVQENHEKRIGKLETKMV